MRSKEVSDVKMSLKHLGVVLAVSFLLAVAPGVLAQTVSDVPPNHWAYEAVNDLVKRGYLSAQDGVFQGDQPVDRFTLATVVARILHEIETGGVAPQSQEDVELLRRVVDEFRSDLVAAYARIDQADGRLDQNTKSIGVVEEKISEVITVVGALSDQVDALDRRVTFELSALEAAQQAALQAEVIKIRDSLKLLEEMLVDGQESLREQVLAMIASLRQDTDSLRQDTDARIRALEESIREALSEKDLVLYDVEETIGTQARSLTEQAEAIIAVDERLRDESLRLDALQELLQGLGADLSQLTAGIEEAIMELRSELNAQSEAMAAQQIALRNHDQTLAEHGDILDAHEISIAELQHRLADQVDALRRQGEALSAADAELLKGIEGLFAQTEMLSAADAELLEKIESVLRQAEALGAIDAQLAEQVQALRTAEADIAQDVASVQARISTLENVVQRLEGMKAQIDGVERQVLAMQSQIGLSEEQLRALSDRLMQELESQYQHSFLLAGTVSEELKALKEEFNSYRQKTERELSGARSAQTFGLIGVLLGLIGLVN